MSKPQIQHEYGDEQADAGRNCRTRLAGPISQAGTRTEGNIIFPCSADHEQDWKLYVMAIHTYEYLISVGMENEAHYS